jgi:Flp pilus assembly protein TadG
MFQRNHQKGQSRRRGTATVELACVAPILILLVVGLFEVGRAVMVKEALSDAARRGARSAILPLHDSATVKSDVLDVLAANGLPTRASTVTISVNDAQKDVSKAKRGDKIAVTVAIPLSKTTWVGAGWYSDQSVVSETVVMVHQ